MSFIDLKDRYDSFQKDAVRAIVSDFAQKLSGRYLLVIPTGGGKTITAAKAVCQLFDDKVLDAEKDVVLWTAHRQELLAQARDAFTKVLEGRQRWTPSFGQFWG